MILWSFFLLDAAETTWSFSEQWYSSFIDARITIGCNVSIRPFLCTDLVYLYFSPTRASMILFPELASVSKPETPLTGAATPRAKRVEQDHIFVSVSVLVDHNMRMHSILILYQFLCHPCRVPENWARSTVCTMHCVSF
jgi:hypothetical protein